MSAERLARLADAIVRWGLLALVVYTPLAFGTVEPWAIALLQWGIWSLVLIAGIGAALGGRGSHERRPVRTGLEVPLLLFVLFCLAGTVPLPLAWVRAISPGVASMYEVSDVPRATGLTLPPAATAPESLLRPDLPDRRPLSANPAVTRERLLMLVSLAALFLLAAHWSAAPGRARFLLLGVAITGFLVSLFGLVQYLTWNGMIYWYRRVPSTSAFGPFVNHNHFAGYVGMIIPIAVCFAFSVAERRRERPGGDDLWFDRWGRAGLALYGAIVLVVALFFSLSRGGLLASAASGLVLFTLVARRLGSRLMVWSTAALLVIVVVALIGWIGADVVSSQVVSVGSMGSEASFQSRIAIWSTMLRNLSPFLWAGSGFGTFEESFARFTPAGSTRRWDRAHNDYLQLLWETGLVGVTIFLSGAAYFCRRYWWPALRARGDSDSLLRIGLAVSLMAIALHSIVDFNLQIGSNGFLFALLCGATVGLHRVHVERDQRTAMPREVPASSDEPRVAARDGSA